MHMKPADAFLISMILWSLILKAKGQVTKLTTATESSSKSSSPKPTLAVIIIILSTMFSLTFLLLCYSKFCHTSSDQPTNNDPDQNLPVTTRTPRSRFSGIDPQLIKSLPFFNFSRLRGSKQGLECAVCISKFQDSDVLRLLPSCKHAFHMECIDQWLNSHSSCPLCRHKYDPSDPDNFAYSNSLRYLRSPSNLSRDDHSSSTVEVFVQREQQQDGGEDCDFVSSDHHKATEQLLLFHKLNHRVILSEVAVKNRWSEVNSSDMLSLNSEMLRVVSGGRFCSAASSTTQRLNMEKVKEDMGKKRVYESKLTSCGVETSRDHSSINIGNGGGSSIARRTVQWFAAGRQGELQGLQYQPEAFSL